VTETEIARRMTGAGTTTARATTTETTMARATTIETTTGAVSVHATENAHARETVNGLLETALRIVRGQGEAVAVDHPPLLLTFSPTDPHTQLTHSLSYSLAYVFTHSPIHSLTHPLTLLFTRSLTRTHNHSPRHAL
jgi:hypothetical protein